MNTLGTYDVVVFGSIQFRDNGYKPIGRGGASVQTILDAFRPAAQSISVLIGDRFARPDDITSLIKRSASGADLLLLYYFGYARTRLEGEDILLAHPASRRSRESTHISLKDVLGQAYQHYSNVVLVLDVANGIDFSSNDLLAFFNEYASSRSPTVVVRQAPLSRNGSASGADLLTSSLATTIRTASSLVPIATVDQICRFWRVVSPDATGRAEALLFVRSSTEAQSALATTSISNLWLSDEERLSSANRGSREDALQELYVARADPARRQDADDLLRWFSVNDASVEVREAASRLLNTSVDEQIIDGLVSSATRKNDTKFGVTNDLILLYRELAPAWRAIPGGTFTMGSDLSRDHYAQREEMPAARVFLPDYHIGRTGVLRSHWLTYCNQIGKSLPPSETVASMLYFAEHPVVGVSWYEAVEFSEWLTALGHASGRLPECEVMQLPTEAQWEKAARGPKARLFPWGHEFQPGICNSRSYGPDVTTPALHFSPAGDSQYKVADMAGNTWEWTTSIWGPSRDRPQYTYPYVSDDGREELSAPSTYRRIIRGGGHYYFDWCLRAATRNCMLPITRHSSGGFRLVRILKSK